MKNFILNKRYIHVSTNKYIYTEPFLYNEINLRNVISILDVNKKYSILFHLITKNQLLSLGDRILFDKDFHFIKLNFAIGSRLEELMGRYDFNGEGIIVMQYKEWFDDINKVVIKKVEFNDNLDILKNIKINKLDIELLDKLPINSNIDKVIINDFNIELENSSNELNNYNVIKDNIVVEKFVDNKLLNKRIINDNIIIKGSKNDFTVDKIIKLKNNFVELDKYEWNILDLDKIHALDIEAYLDDNNNFIPYAIGYHKKDFVKMFYKDNNQNIILECFNDIFKNDDFHNHTFYAHNMGKFDGLLIINNLLDHGFTFELIKKENVILGIQISKNKITISLKDSLNLLSGSLDNIAREFKIDTKKGDFPY